MEEEAPSFVLPQSVRSLPGGRPIVAKMVPQKEPGKIFIAKVYITIFINYTNVSRIPMESKQQLPNNTNSNEIETTTDFSEPPASLDMTHGGQHWVRNVRVWEVRETFGNFCFWEFSFVGSLGNKYIVLIKIRVCCSGLN